MFRKKLTTSLIILTVAIAVAGIFAFVDPVFAQTDVGLDTVGGAAGLSDDGLGTIIGRIIQVFMGALGVIFLGILLYGGFLWMTAAGDDEKIDKAKKILINGTIGLVFIVASFAITTFVMSGIDQSVGGGSGGSGGGAGGSGGGLGGGSVVVFSISEFSPEGEYAGRKIVPRITFSHRVDADTVDGAVTFTNASTNEEVSGELKTDGSVVTFTPDEPCPAPNEGVSCFDETTTYNVTIHGSIENTDGLKLNCEPVCNYSFTSGTIVDVDDPTVQILYPESGARIAASALTIVEVGVTDDLGVSGANFAMNELVFDSVGAVGTDLTDVFITSVWDNAGLADDNYYTLEVTAYDIAGNSDMDSLRVKINPYFCDNDRLDSDLGELGIDCGGACGACNSTSCEINDDCASGLCLEDVCSTLPAILSVTPSSGAPGTYVTVFGIDFGSRGGVIEFTGATGPVAASIPSCSDGWSDTQIIVEVPVGAIDGPITITTRSDLQDSTNNDFGLYIVDFDVNTVFRPSLCKLSPTSGAVGDNVYVSGKNFGGEQLLSDIRFNSDVASTYNSWSDGNISAVVPSLPDYTYDVAVNVDGVISNTIAYTVGAADPDDGSDGPGDGDGDDGEESLPVISYINPTSGGIGQYVTIVGSNFGLQPGFVFFENRVTGEVAEGSIDFPNACADDFWSDKEVTVIVPEYYSNDAKVIVEEHDVYIVNNNGDPSSRVLFNVTDEDITPGLCRIIPDKSAIGSEIVLAGDGFGASIGAVTFYNEVGGLDIISWKSDEVVVEVPDAATTGPVILTSNVGLESNSINFEVGVPDAPGDKPEVQGAAYGWSFSTGTLPRTPEMDIVCNDTQVSGVPNSRFTNEVCVNAIIYGEFNVEMDTTTIVDGTGVIVEECTNDRCTNTDIVAGIVSTTSSSSGTTFSWIPVSDYNGGVFKTETEYTVTITASVLSADGTPLQNDVIWDFGTRESDEKCKVEKVLVSPISETINIKGNTTEFAAVASTRDCIVLDSDAYSWNWDVNASFASIEEGDCENTQSDSCALATALAEGTTDVIATEVDSSIAGNGELVIDYTDPYVVNASPQCTEACINAGVEARFNIPMDVGSVQGAESAVLKECRNELCVEFGDTVASSAQCIDGEGGVCIGLKFNNLSLKTDTFYRVIISGDVMSSSNVPLTRTNYGEDYSWVFRVRDSNELCLISRIGVEPSEVTLKNIGERQIFSVSAYGNPDSCSVAGQKIETSAYSWDWTDPILTEEGVAEWLKIGDYLIDSSQRSIPDGCTSSCLAMGSEPASETCGNNFVGVGEDCDDGNVADGDGCSPSCLAEGINIIGAVCGDGVIISSVNGGGEECDDGNENDGDGCSSSCTREGSDSVGATCGNGDIARTSTGAGEDCDDGNTKSGDGCSAVCLNEGTQRDADVHATCGDGTIKVPYETCDDHNLINGDGCSSSCLREGFHEIESSCGDGIIDRNETTQAGEDCDGEEGCGRDCLWLGSSINYEIPSICGDGIWGTGEYEECKGTAGDGTPDGTQIAFISDSAGDYVDIDTQKAQATIEVSTGSVNLVGKALITLSCVAISDDDCDEGFGPADNRCCMPRPKASVQPVGIDVCRNAGVYAIFDQKMNTSTFSDNAYIRLVDPAIGCPESHEVAYAGDEDRSWIARAWQSITRFIVPKLSAQPSGCVLPVSGFTQHERPDGTFQVGFNYNVALESNALYEVVLEGDILNDEELDGILTSYGVAMDSDVLHRFTTSDRLCELDKIEVNDSFSDHPGVFRTASEPHDLYATALTNRNGSFEELQAIPGVYDWEWGEWREDSDGQYVTFKTQDVNTATVMSTEESGRTHVTAEARIITDTDHDTVDPETGIGRTVTGNIAFNAVICANPWPAYVVNFPYENDRHHFSTYYCRDAGDDGTEDDLPALLDVVKAPDSGSDLVLDEYFFKVNDGSSDAIGVRVAENPNYLSPADWYKENGFLGTPREIEIDGLEAIEVGRSVYIAAPNVTEIEIGQTDKIITVIYPNIYVISYNEMASSSTREIFDALLQNLHLLTNKTVGLCINAEAGGYTNTACSTDWDCLEDEDAVECGAYGEKLRRDMKRLTDATTIARVIEDYGRENGLCSLTTNQTCQTSGDCPGVETCLPSVPQLESGTFLRSAVSSAWGSWNDQFASVLGSSVPSDPMNGYATYCGEGTDYPGYSSESCVNETNGQYVCPVGAYTYHYFAKGDFGYELHVDLEHDSVGKWALTIDGDRSDNRNITVHGDGMSFMDFSGTPFCDGTPYGASNICGDGVVGADEACELGQRANAVPAMCADDVPGTIAQICNADCTAFQDAAIEECVPIACGNGVLDPGEQCDDGSSNGRYGYCGNDCTYSSSLTCGDGTLAAGEACDCGLAYASGLAYGGSVCSAVNGTYAANPGQSCSWDCSGPAAYCGDGVIDDAEQCDGDTEEYAGKLCMIGKNEAQPCESNVDCPQIYFDFATNQPVIVETSCGSGGNQYEWANECPNTNVCIIGEVVGGVNMLGRLCVQNIDCGVSGVCSEGAVQTIRTMTCADDGANNNTCEWNDDSWRSIDCLAPTNCGNGLLEPGEQCDDGNSDTNDSCTNECSSNVCGDGYLYYGIEDCDEGGDNGKMCSAAYGSSCNYCSESCKLVTTSGTFCGDSEINGGEYCDGVSVPYGAGICNGGVNNGVACTDNSQCSGGNCALPVCANDCRSACPSAYKTSLIEMRTNQIGASRSSSVDLQSADSESAIRIADSATLYIPQCTAATALYGDVIFENLNFPDSYVLFVTDLSSSMGTVIQSRVQSNGNVITRLGAVKESIISSTRELFKQLDGDVEIGTVGFGEDIGSLYAGSIQNVDTFGPVGENDQSLLISEIQSYRADGDSPYIFDGLHAAKMLMDQQLDGDAEKIIVLVTDSSWSSIERSLINTTKPNPEYWACQIKDAGYQLYTIALTTVGESRAQYDPTDCDEYKNFDGSYMSWDEYKTAVANGTATRPLKENPEIDYGSFSDLVSSSSSSALDASKPTTLDPYSPTSLRINFNWLNPVKNIFEGLVFSVNAATVDPVDELYIASEEILNDVAGWSSGNPNSENNIDYAHSSNDSGEIHDIFENITQNILDSVLGVDVAITVNGVTTRGLVQSGNYSKLPWPEGFSCKPNSPQNIEIEAFFEGGGRFRLSNVNLQHCAP